MWKNLARLTNYVNLKTNGFYLKQTPRDPGKIKFPHIRVCSTTSSGKNEKPSEEYFMIYRLKEIRFLSTCSKLKMPFFGGTALATPILAICEFSNVFDTYTTVTFATFGFSLVAGLSLYSIAFENTIGIIKHNAKKDKLMISYIDFWGKRNDEIIPIENWIPLCDLPGRFSDKFYYTVEYSNSNMKRKLYVRDSYIRNKEIFKTLLGFY